MVHVEDSITIDAPLDEVFDYLDTPENQVEITPSLSASELIERLDNGGSHVRFTYSMAGISLDGEVRATTYEPNERIEFEMTNGPLDGTITWTFDADGGATHVTYAADYTVPTPVLQSVAEAFAQRYNERELQTTLQNLKDRLEAA
jgi:uncharacterized membrane protein